MPKVSRVLVIDASPAFYRRLHAGLDKISVEIKQATDGKQGLALCSDWCPDLVLLDAVLPNGEDGFAFFQRLLAEDLPPIPVIFMVAEEDNELQIKGFELGAVDCIAKSASDHAVSVRVRNALRHKQREDELQRLCQIDVDTGFWNQAHFDLRLHEHLSAFLRYQRGSCLLLLEVDVRAEAEEIMPWSEITRLIAQVIRGLCRDCDVLSHWQQGRFALILPGTYESGALLLAERLRAEVVLAIGEHQSKSTVLPSIAVLSTEILTERQWVTLSHCRQATEQVLQRVSLAGGNAIATVGREELLRVGAALSGSEQEQMVAEQQQQDACQLSDFHTIMPLVIERVEFEELMAFLVRQVQSLLSIKAVWVALLGNRQDGLDCHYATDAYQPILARSLAMNNAFLSAVTAQHEVTDWRGSWFDNHQLYHELAVPLYTGSQFIGVLGVGLTDSERCFSDQNDLSYRILSRIEKIADVVSYNCNLPEISKVVFSKTSTDFNPVIPGKKPVLPDSKNSGELGHPDIRNHHRLYNSISEGKNTFQS